MVKLTVVIVQLPSWLFNLHDYSTYMTLWLYPWVFWTSTLHYIDYIVMTWSTDVAEETHDTTQHDTTGMHTLDVLFMSSCCSAEWWVCPWCTIASPMHDKVRRVFNGLSVCLIVHACSHVSFACYLAYFICSPNHVQVF